MKYEKPMLDQNSLPISGAIDEILIKYCAALAEIERLNNKTTSEHIPNGLTFRESDLGQAINCTEMELYFNDNPALKTYLTQRINKWLDFHRSERGIEAASEP